MELSPASPYCLRWRQGRGSWRHRSEGGFDSRRYDVAPLAERHARAFVEAHHYSASFPAARLRYGLYDGVQLVGVAVLSVPVRREVLTAVFPNLEPYEESLELGRFVLLDQVPANAESWFLARVWTLVGREGLRGVVSFSDPVARRTSEGRIVFAGHLGLIYQASNARYLDRSTPRSLKLLRDGSVLSDRTIQKIRAGERGHEAAERLLVGLGAPGRRAGEDPARWLAAALMAIDARTIRHPGNHRYAFAVGPKAERRAVSFALPSLPYPKKLEAA